LQFPLFLSYDKVVRKTVLLLLIILPVFLFFAIAKPVLAAANEATGAVACMTCIPGSEPDYYYPGKCLDTSTEKLSDPVACSTTAPVQPISLCQNGTSCPTALGDLPTALPDLLTKIFSIALSLAGIIALGLIITAGYRLMLSQGNPEQVKGAREQLTAAIIGLLFIIFSLVILQVIGVNILSIPGFGA
jgi:hypothetical protein